MWIKKPDQGNPPDSGVYDVGFLFKHGNIYVMDNHAAAGWCWLNELDPKKDYNFFHIDRHFDLIDNISRSFLRDLKISDLATIDQYLALKTDVGALMGSQVFRFDNYIMNIFHILPNFFNNNIFATHRDGHVADAITINYYPEITSLHSDLAYQVSQDSRHKWILNLDLDYFFTDLSSTQYFQFLSDRYIDLLCDQILRVSDRIAVITIAMSDYFCNGQENSRHVLERVGTKLGFKVEWPG
ncbi:UPF0489 family protein [Pedobacter miscanthi]|uniref:UPF0489 family protein n=1 Tax=Pedobacter miscanthi TaxID=2259170 RepID=UPI00292DD3ED|nr:UPF0489 family protein [Pedobacter miscanthi]